MVAEVFIFVLAFLTWNAESQHLSGTGFQQTIPSSASVLPCGCLSGKQFSSLSGQTGSDCRSQLSNARSQCDTISLNSGSNCVSHTGPFASKRSSLLSNTGPQCDSIGSNFGSLSNDCGCSSSTCQFLDPLSQTLRPIGLRNMQSQCDSTSSLGVYGTGPCSSLSNLNAPPNFPSVKNCGTQRPPFISNCPNGGHKNFVGPITSQVTETITTQVPSLSGEKQFVSETFVTRNPCKSCSSLSQNIGQFNGDINCASPVTETCIRTVDDDESMSTTLANALQLLIVSNLIENLNEAAALGTFSSPQLPCNSPGCNDFLTSNKPIVTGCSNIPSLYSPSCAGPLSPNSFGSPCQTSCNNRLRESFNQIRVPPLSTFGGVPEIVHSKISCGAPHIPDVINPTNLKLAEAINCNLPTGVLPSYNRNFANSINPIHLPSLAKPSVLPEIGNPVNLPSLCSPFPNKAEGNPFKVQSFGPLAPPPGILAYNGPLQLSEPLNNKQFNGPLLTDASNNISPVSPEISNYNQFNEPPNPFMALLNKILADKANGYTHINPFESPETYNPYSPCATYPEQNLFGGSYEAHSKISNQYGSAYPLSTTALLQSFSPQSPVFPSLGSSSYTSYPEAYPISLSSSSYASDAFSQTSPSSFNNGFTDILSSANSYSHPNVVYVPVDIPGVPITLSGTLPEVPFSVTPSESYSEIKDIPSQFTFEPLMAELLIPSSIPADLIVNCQ